MLVFIFSIVIVITVPYFYRRNGCHPYRRCLLSLWKVFCNMLMCISERGRKPEEWGMDEMDREMSGVGVGARGRELIGMT